MTLKHYLLKEQRVTSENYENEQFFPFLMFHKEIDNVLHICTKWNKSCACGETANQSF